MAMRQALVELIGNEILAPGTCLHTYRDAEIAREAQPGQFINVRPSLGNDPLLRRPLSICSVDREAETFTVLIKEVGMGTRLLLAMRPGERLDMLAPLGTIFDWQGAGRLLLVAGGVGVAPMLFTALEARMVPDRPEVIFCYGARSAADFVLLERIEPLVDRLVLTTNDGSRGERGFITEAAERFFTPEARILTCGPNPMMNDLLRRMRAAGLEGQVSLENQMGCGIGACQGCVVPTRRGFIRICIEGPVMDTGMLDAIAF